MWPFSSSVRMTARVAENVGGSGKASWISAAVACPRPQMMFMTCRSRRLSGSAELFCFGMLQNQHHVGKVAYLRLHVNRFRRAYFAFSKATPFSFFCRVRAGPAYFVIVTSPR